MRRHLRLFVVAFASVLALSHCAGGAGGGGCSCMEPLAGGFPVAEESPGVMQLRVSKTGLKFLEQNAQTLIAGLLPTGLDFDVPPTCDQSAVIGTIHICADKVSGACVAQDPPCKVSSQVAGVELVPVATPGDTLKALIRMRIKTPPGNEIKTKGILSCTVSIDTAAAGKPEAAVLVDVKFKVDPTSKRTSVALENVAFAELDDNDITLSGGLLCGLGNLPFIKGFLIDSMIGQLAGSVQGIADSQLCTACDAAGACPSGATCDTGNNRCMLGSSCLQSLGIEGRMNLSALPGSSGAVDVLATLGDSVAMPNSGMTLGMNGGMAPAAVSSCVKPRPDLKPNPKSPALPKPATLTGNATPKGVPYDLGIGVHQRFLDQAGWSMYTSGGLCLEVGTELSPLLSSEAFSLLMPSINALIGSGSAPVRLKITPGAPPIFKLGTGAMVDKGNGEYEITDPLIDVTLPDFTIDLMVLVEERYVRVLRLKSDVALPVGLVYADGKIQPVLGALDKAFTNLRVTDSDLLTESPEELQTKFPVVLKLALGFLPDALAGGFALPDLMGLKIVAPTFTSVENNSLLAIFAQLAAAPPAGNPAMPGTPIPGTPALPHDPLPGNSGARPTMPVETEAALVELRMPDDPAVLRLRTPSDLSQGPAAVLALGGGDELEHAWRIDRGPWSPFVSGSRLELRSALFFLLGEHIIEVRSRRRDDALSLDPTPVALSLRVEDPTARPPAAPAQQSLGGCAIAGAERAPSGWWLAGLALLYARRRRRGSRRLRRLLTLSAPVLLLALLVGCDCNSSTPGDTDAGVCGADQYRCNKTGACEAVEKTCKTDPGCGPGTEISYGDNPTLMDPDTCSAIAQDCSCVEKDALTPGVLGRYSAVAVGGGKILASGYEDRFGDLVLFSASLTALDKVSTELVDGVPDTVAATHGPSGWRGGVSAEGDDVGLYSDIAVDAAGLAMIAYHDATNRSLKFARQSGEQWQIHTVASPASDGEIVGRHTSLTLVDGKPAVAFLVINVDAGDGRFDAELRWAVASSAAPAADSDWTISKIDGGRMSCRNLCGDGEACFVEANGDAQCFKTGSGCSACASGEECRAGACQAVLEQQKFGEVPVALGLWPDTVVTGAGPVVVYYDGVRGNLMAARGASGTFTTATVLGTADDDVGAFPSAAVDDSGLVHVAYQDNAAQSAHYVVIDPATLAVSSGPVLVDSGVRTNEVHPVGADTGIAVTSSGSVRVVYQDQLTSDLLSAERDGANTWMPSDAADANLGRLLKGGPKGYGFFSDLAVADGKIYGSTMFFDAKGTPRGNIEFFSIP